MMRPTWLASLPSAACQVPPCTPCHLPRSLSACSHLARGTAEPFGRGQGGVTGEPLSRFAKHAPPVTFTPPELTRIAPLLPPRQPAPSPHACSVQGAQGLCVRALSIADALVEVAHRDRGHLSRRPRLGRAGRQDAVRFLLLHLPEARDLRSVHSHQRWLVTLRASWDHRRQASRSRFWALA